MFRVSAFVISFVVLIAQPVFSANFDEAMRAYEKGDFAFALKELEVLSNEGDPNAQYSLGVMYYEGSGVERNSKIAASLFNMSAKQGNPYAKYNLGVIYRDEDGLKDADLAFKWMSDAAHQGLVVAQYNLGYIYQEGIGTGKNAVAAINWYKRAAESGDPEAQRQLGSLYLNGFEGIEKDHVKAAKWILSAAKQHLPIAQNDAGVLYQNGYGVRKDPTEAAKWYGMAAKQGLAIAQSNLAFLYAQGLGVEKSPETAVGLWELAAKQNFEPAQKALERIRSQINQTEKSDWLYVAWFFVSATIVIYVHVFGHFIACKIFGIKTNLVSFGFGPRLKSIVSGDTEWRICIIPLGCYAVTATSNSDEGGIFPKTAVLFAGVISNSLFFAVVMSGLYFIAGEPSIFDSTGQRVLVLFSETMMMPFREMSDFLMGVREESLTSLSTGYTGLAGLACITAVWSLKFGAINLIPLPKFDGWRVLNLTASAVVGEKTGGRLVKWGVALLVLSFLAFATWNDLRMLGVF